MKFKRLQWFFCRCWVLSCSALTDHERRALLRQHEGRDTPLWLLLPTHTTNNTSPPNNDTDLSLSARSSRRRGHVAGGLSGRPCVVYGGLPHARTHSSRRRAGYAASARPVRVGGGACPWMWLCGRWRRCAEARRRRDAVVRQERRFSRMTKNSELGCRQTPFRYPGAMHGS